MGHGGKRAGAGRKPKIEEQKLIERLDNIIDSDDALKKLKDLINDGNYNAIKLYFEYRFGKPTEKVDVTTNGNNIPNAIGFYKANDKD